METMEGLCVTDCTRCPALSESRGRIVNGVGPADADLLFVGEAPGEREDAEGEPFVGRSGEVLDGALRDHGLPRDAVRITNCVRCRPPENRDPTGTELDNCRGYLEAEIGLVDPVVIVTLGKVPSEHLLSRSVSVTREAGELERVELGGTPRDVLICVHPAASLYDPDQRETLDRAIGRAASMVGSGGQSSISDF